MNIKFEKVHEDDVETGICAGCRKKKVKLTHRKPTIVEYRHGLELDHEMRLYYCKNCVVLESI